MLTPQLGNEALAENRRTAFLGGLCLFLSVIEYAIPKPLPFMRIGLANLPLLLALDILKPKDFFLLALIKVLGQGIVGGTLFSYIFLFSLAGTFASAAVMFVLRRMSKKIGFAGIGCAGAMVSNAVQLFLARYFIFSAAAAPALRFLIPPFLASGLVTGIALGIICELFCRQSQWRAGVRKSATLSDTGEKRQYGESPDKGGFAVTDPAGGRERGPGRWSSFFNADELFIAGMIMALLFLFSPSLTGRVLQFAFFVLLAIVSGRKKNMLVTVLVMAGIVIFNLLVPHGRVLVSFGPLRITQENLFAGLERAVTLTGLVMLSAACIKSDLRLPGRIGSLLGESLRMLELLRRQKITTASGNIFQRIDKILLETEAAACETQPDTSCKRPKRSIRKILLLFAMAAFTAVLGMI